MTSTFHKSKFGNNSKNSKFPGNYPDIGDEWETVNLNRTNKIK